MKYAITGRHPGLGTITFVIEAADKRLAFSTWKNVVVNCRQWIITSNDPVAEIAECKRCRNERAALERALADEELSI
jgi:hypothetical protein